VTRRPRDDTPPGGWIGPTTTGWPDLPEFDPPAQQRVSTAHAAGPDGKGWWKFKPGPTPAAKPKGKAP
jgi:hypothetical protein